jgi:thiol-disulfide isomerase/thioredoxin
LFLTSVGLMAQPTVAVFEKYEQLEKELLPSNDTCYVVNFWATWCAPCVKELPYFEAFSKQVQGQKIKVILVSLDFKAQVQTRLIPFLTSGGYASKVVVLADKDYNTWLTKVDPEWSGAIPATLLMQGKRKFFAEQSFENTKELRDFIYSFYKNN